MAKVIQAAGTVALKGPPGDTPKVLLVHRPAYDDWSLPKGKLEPDEYPPVAAFRETEEETGVRVRLGVPLAPISYKVGGGKKTVWYWKGTVLSSKRHKPDREVDKVTWLTPRAALARMSYEDEKHVLLEALAAPETTPFLIVRHGKAMLRKNWSGRDQLRPVNTRGRRQARDLVDVLAAYGVTQLASSSSLRCMQTLAEYSRKTGIHTHGWSTLSEEVGEENPKAVKKLMQQLAKSSYSKGEPMAVCGHRPVLPMMFAAMGVPDRPMQTGATAVLHLDAHGTLVHMEWHKPRH